MLPLKDTKNTNAHIKKHATLLKQMIEMNYEHLINELLVYESFETAVDEIQLSLDCLKNISEEMEWLASGKVKLLCAITPINLPLYSLIIFAIVPSFMAEEVVMRPPVLMREVLQKILELLKIQASFPHIKFTHIERRLFDEAYVSVSDVVIFTGNYTNAQIVHGACPEALFIYDGAGINPLIITDTADTDLAVQKMTKTRIFNSGQDCAGADAIFVHKKIADVITKKLLKELETIIVGDYLDHNVRVGRIIKSDNLQAVQDFFNTHTEQLLYGGEIDYKNSIVYPTVFSEDIKKIDTFTNTEFFAPVFHLIIYQNNEDLRRYFSRKEYSDYAMYASIFGDTSIKKDIPNSVILHNAIINDVERGNSPYGGYGPKTNYISYNGTYHHRPILISKEIFTYLQIQTRKINTQ
jgi:acyl-CoA reductase-like NAD-dependent aldehyde dehydrogenase